MMRVHKDFRNNFFIEPTSQFSQDEMTQTPTNLGGVVKEDDFLEKPKESKSSVARKLTSLRQKQKTRDPKIFSAINLGKTTSIAGSIMLLSRSNIVAGAMLGIGGLFTYLVARELHKNKIFTHR